MRIARLNFRWRVEGFGHVVHDCLEELALVQGYRVNGICRELGLSESYLRELFLRDVGLGPKEWMQWERMVVARRMLMWGMDPGEVTERLGFTHHNSFRTAFRQFHGMTPSRFMETRKEALGSNPEHEAPGHTGVRAAFTAGGPGGSGFTSPAARWP